MFRRFGAAVTIVGHGPHLLDREDPDVSEALEKVFRAEGIALELGARVESARRDGRRRRPAARRRPRDRRLAPARRGRPPPEHRRPRLRRGRREARRARLRRDRRRLRDEREGRLRGRRRDGRSPVHARVVGRPPRPLRAPARQARAAQERPARPVDGVHRSAGGRRGSERARGTRERGVAFEVATMPFGDVARAIEIDETAGTMKVLVDPADRAHPRRAHRRGRGRGADPHLRGPDAGRGHCARDRRRRVRAPLVRRGRAVARHAAAALRPALTGAGAEDRRDPWSRRRARTGLSPMTTADSADAASHIERSLSTLRATFRARFEAAATEQALRDENAKILGKKGELTAILKQMGAVPADDAQGDRRAGQRRSSSEVESAFDDRLRALARACARRRARRAALRSDAARRARPRRCGHAHPISLVRDEIVDVFREPRLRRARRARGRARGEQLHQARLPAGSPGDRHAGQLLDQGRAAPAHAHEQRPGPRDEHA